MLLYLVAFLITLVISVYLFFTWNFNYWEKRGILYEKPKFFFGNLKEVFSGTKHIGLIYCDLYKKFNNVSYFGFFKLRTPTLVIRDLDIIKDVLVKEFTSFPNNDFHVDKEVDPILAGNIFMVTGEEWKVRRSHWSAAMTSNKLKAMQEVLHDKCNTMVEYLNEHVKHNPKEPLDVLLMSAKCLTDIIVNGVLGLQVNSFKDPDNLFISTSRNVFVSDFWAGLMNIFYIITPWVHKIIGSSFVNKTMEKRLLEITKNVIDVRRKHGFLKNDFFESLMTTDKVDDLEVAGRVFAMFTDAIETSSGVVAFMLYEMAANPHVQTRLRQEIIDTAAENDGKLNYENILKMPYLEMIMLETLRKHPPIFTMSKVCTKPFELPPSRPGGKPFKVPVGMAVTIPNFATQTNPEYFPDPDTFDPERFSEESKGNITKYSFLPFGDGPRICVGMRLGIVNSKTMVSYIVRNFEIRVSPKTKVPLEVDPNVIVNRVTGGAWLEFRKVES